MTSLNLYTLPRTIVTMFTKLDETIHIDGFKQIVYETIKWYLLSVL